jgi:hypothetical protein
MGRLTREGLCYVPLGREPRSLLARVFLHFFLERPLKGTQKKWFGSHGVTDPTAVGSLGSLYKLLGMVHSFSSPELSDRSDSVRSQVF